MPAIRWFVWGVALAIFIAQLVFIFHRDRGLRRLAMRFAFLIAIGLAFTAFTNFSKLHLLWWVPLAFFLNIFFFAADINRKTAKFAERIQSENNENV
ncbi:MAG: hypothetical protein ACYTDW_12910 [Planctomycetota bacterium]|jgi:hypothetical protein